MVRVCDLTTQGCLLILITFTPLAFGTVYPWGIALMEGMALLMALAWVFKVLHAGRLRLVHTSLNLPILLGHLIGQLAQHPERAAQWSRQLVQTATHLDPTGAFTHYSAGPYALQQWEALPSEEWTRIVQQLRSAVQIEPKYATAILQALWERTQDRDFVWAVARGTPEEELWRIDGGKIVGGR